MEFTAQDIDTALEKRTREVEVCPHPAYSLYSNRQQVRTEHQRVDFGNAEYRSFLVIK